MYPFGTCELSMDGGFVKMKTKAAQWSSLVFDTVPKEIYINDWNHKYLSFMVCSDTAFSGQVRLVDPAGKYQKLVDVNFTGKWQRVIIDISGTDGWFNKDENGAYTVPATVAPYSKEGKNMYGGFRFSLPGKASTEQYHLDYIGFFSDKTTAETYSVMATEGESVSKLDTEKIEDDFKIVSGVDEENTAVFYNMRVPLGEEIPFGKGRVNDCYFPDAERTGKYNTPEMYPFGSCELTMEGGFVKMKPKAAQWSSIVFDTVPKELYINDYNHRYLTFMVCSNQAFNGQVRLRDPAGKYQKLVDVEFTGKWQRVIIDISGTEGWFNKDENGEYTVPATVAPYSKEGKNMYGGFRFSLPGTASCSSYHIDFLGFFADKAKAEAFSVMATEGESVWASLMSDVGTAMESVKYYQENKGDNFLYELRPEYRK